MPPGVYDPEKEEQKNTLPSEDTPEFLRRHEDLNNPDNNDNQPAGDPSDPRALKSKENSSLPGQRHPDQVGAGHTGSGEGLSSLRGMIRGRKNKVIAGLVLAGAAIAVSIALFLALLPLKILHIVTGLENRFFASAEQAVQQEVDTMLNTYLKKYALKQLNVERCGKILSTTNRNCKVVNVIGDGLIGNMYKGWAQARLETNLAEKFGIEFERRGGGNGHIYMKAYNLGIPDGVDINDFADGPKTNIWDSDGFKKVGRSEVRAAVRDAFQNESFWKKTMYRYKVGRLLEVKYGIKRCIFFCSTRDRFADWKDEKGRDIRKTAYKVIFNQRVLGTIGSMYGAALECIFTGCNPTEIDPANSIDTNQVDKDGCKKNCLMNGGALSGADIEIFGNGAGRTGLLETESNSNFGKRENAISTSKRIEEKGFVAVLGEDLNKKIEQILFGIGGEHDGGIGALKKFLGLIGLIYTADIFLNFTQNGAATLQKYAYDINAANAVQVFGIYRTYADEAKSGHVDPAMVGSFTQALAAGTHCDNRQGVVCDKQVGGTAGAEGTSVYSAIFGTPSKQVASTSFDSRVYAASDNETFTYKCKDDKPVPAGQVTCKDTNLNQTDEAVEVLKGLQVAFEPICNVLCGITGWFASIINAMLDFLANTIGGILEAVFGWFFDWLADKLHFVIDFIKMVFEKLIRPMIMVSGEMSGGRTVDIMALGADKAGSDYSHNSLGGVLLTNDQITATLTERQQEQNYLYDKKSFFARMFDTSSQQAPLVKLAMSMPSDKASTIGNISSMFTNPFGKLFSVLGSLFNRSTYAIAPDALMCEGGLKGDCFGVTQYGYPIDDPIFSADPEEYWNSYCTDGLMNKAYNYWSAQNLNEDTTWAPENPQGPIPGDLEDSSGNIIAPKLTDPKGTNPCLLLQNAAAAGGGLYTDAVFSPEDLVGTGTTGGTDGGIATGTAQELARRILSYKGTKYSCDNPGDCTDLEHVANGQSLEGFGTCRAEAIDVKVLQIMLTLIENQGMTLGTYALCSDHESNAERSRHNVGFAVDISSLNGQAINSSSSHAAALKVMQWFNSLIGTNMAPDQLLNQGTGSYSEELDNLSMNNHQSSPKYTSLQVGGHMDHIHVGF